MTLFTASRVAFLATALATAFQVAAQAPAVPNLDPATQRDLERFSSFRVGTYQSIAQRVGDGDSTPTTMRIARIWPERGAQRGEFWFYIELARGEAAPYLQRLVLSRADDRGDLEELEYELPGDAKDFAGAWKSPSAFDKVDPSTLKAAAGCRMTITPQGVTTFAAGTVGKECRYRMPPGAYRASDYYLTSSSLRGWDRGYDAQGKVVWGSQDGSLEFRRIAQQPR